MATLHRDTAAELLYIHLSNKVHSFLRNFLMLITVWWGLYERGEEINHPHPIRYAQGRLCPLPSRERGYG